jgi:hypothetical protein
LGRIWYWYMPIRITENFYQNWPLCYWNEAHSTSVRNFSIKRTPIDREMFTVFRKPRKRVRMPRTWVMDGTVKVFLGWIRS